MSHRQFSLRDGSQHGVSVRAEFLWRKDRSTCPACVASTGLLRIVLGHDGIVDSALQSGNVTEAISLFNS